MEALHTPAADRLFTAILRLSTVEECYALFEDLCTIREIRDLSQRYEVAAMLGEGKSHQKSAGIFLIFLLLSIKKTAGRSFFCCIFPIFGRCFWQSAEKGGRALTRVGVF